MEKKTLDKIALGENIKTFRIHKHLTQAEFAELIDVSVGSVSQMERGDYSPRLSTFYLICDVLDIDSNVLLSPQIRTRKEVSEQKKSYAKELVDHLNDKQVDTIISVMKDFKES